MSDQLFIKKGRRYVPYGNAGSWYDDRDVMKIGEFRLTYCADEGHYRARYDVTPDTAAFVAAAMIAQHEMEKAITETIIAKPSLEGQPYTDEQKQIVEKFRHDMAATGALVPHYWLHRSAAEVAKAGVDAVVQFENTQQ
jgi:hypothetical protein